MHHVRCHCETTAYVGRLTPHCTYADLLSPPILVQCIDMPPRRQNTFPNIPTTAYSIANTRCWIHKYIRTYITCIHLLYKAYAAPLPCAYQPHQVLPTDIVHTVQGCLFNARQGPTKGSTLSTTNLHRIG